MRLHRSGRNRFSTPRRGRSTALRLLVILLAVVVLVPVLAVVGAVLLVDPNAWRPQVEAAVQRASGRTLHIGRLTLVPAFSPTLGAIDLALANPPGASRPDMVTIARAEVKLALLPLLAGRVEIARVLLVRPDILLERDAAGRPNWRFGVRPAEAPPAEAKPALPAGSPVAGIAVLSLPAGRAGAASDLLVRALRIEDGRLTWSGGDGAAPVQFNLRVLDVAASGLDAPVTVIAQGAYAGQALALTAETGPLARLLDQTATRPWPVKATLEMPGARLAVAGGVVHPLNGEGYTLSVGGAAVNLSALDGLLSARLPPLRQVAFAFRVADAGGRLPEVTGLAVRAGASDLGAFAPGLKLAHAELSAAALGEPVRAEAAGSLRRVPLRVTASFGPLAALLPDPPNPGPYPIELAAEAQGATLAVKGSVAAPARLSGIDLAVTGRIPDLSSLARLAGTSLPALRPVTLDARVADRPGTPGFSIRGLAVTAPEADVSGELMVGLGARPSLQATLSSRRIDLGAVLAALSQTTAAPPPGESFPDLSLPDFSAAELGAPEEAPTGPALPVLPPLPPPPPPPPPLPPKHSGRLIPDGKLPFAALDTADADLRLSIAELRVGGASYRDLSGRLSLQDGRLTLDPVSGALPGGRAELRLSVDSRAVPPPVAVALRAPGLSLKPLLAAFHLPGDITGTAEIDADLRAAGDTPQALAAGLGGRLGVAMTDGELDNRLLGSIAGAVLAGSKVPPGLLGLDRPGSTRIRCLALRADAEGGLATVSTVLLDTSRLLVYGAGTVNLRDEGMALRLRPMLKAGVSVVVPVRVGGSFAAPKVSSDPAANPSAVAGLVAGLGVARGTSLGALASVIANERDGDPCDPALAAARAVPRQPQPQPAAPIKSPNPADILRGLLPR